jgi:hypothetical protein
VLAPEPVDETTFAAYLAGEATPPMLLINPIFDYHPSNCEPYLDLDTFVEAYPPKYFRCTANLSPGSYDTTGRLIVILTSDADFAANEAMYRAAVDFPFTHQYMMHPELRHTLLLSPDYSPPSGASNTVFFPPLAIGYPEGWREQMIAEQHLLIMPETFTDMASAPYVRGYPVADIAEPAAWQDAPFEDRKNNVADWIVTHFGVDKQAFIETYQDSCGLSTPIVPFSHDGRTGYVGYIVDQYVEDQPFILEFSAPDALYSEYQHIIENIAETARTGFGCG